MEIFILFLQDKTRVHPTHASIMEPVFKPRIIAVIIVCVIKVGMASTANVSKYISAVERKKKRRCDIHRLRKMKSSLILHIKGKN